MDQFSEPAKLDVYRESSSTVSSVISPVALESDVDIKAQLSSCRDGGLFALRSQ